MQCRRPAMYYLSGPPAGRRQSRLIDEGYSDLAEVVTQ